MTDKQREWSKNYRQKNKEKLYAYNNAYRKRRYWSNLEASRQLGRTRYAQEKQDPNKYQQYLVRAKKYKASDLGKARHRAKEAKRRSALLKRLPKWVSSEELRLIKLFYADCPKGYHVDHIVPLRGKNVSGLHVLNNLQYLPASENCKKSNKF